MSFEKEMHENAETKASRLLDRFIDRQKAANIFGGQFLRQAGVGLAAKMCSGRPKRRFGLPTCARPEAQTLQNDLSSGMELYVGVFPRIVFQMARWFKLFARVTVNVLHARSSHRKPTSTR